MTTRDIGGETSGLDEDARQPRGLSAHDLLGDAEVLVDVGGGCQHDGAEPGGHVAAEVVVDGGGAKEDEGRELETWLGFALDVLEGGDDGDGAVL